MTETDRNVLDLTLDKCEDCGGAGLICAEVNTAGRRLWRVRCERCDAMGAGFFEEENTKGHEAYKDVVQCWIMARGAWNRTRGARER